MARIKLAYIGGGSTRAAGTMASFAHQGDNFDGSEVVLIDLDEERLDLVQRLARKMMAARGLDITVSATTDRGAGLEDCDAVLTSYRPGGFESRRIDERIPLSFNVIGQETQGPGGFFMALRSITAMQPILEDIDRVCPNALMFNYTNPVNVVAQAVSDHTDTKVVSLCEGPIVFPTELAAAVGLDPDKLDVASVGLNHGSWSVRTLYDGQPLIPILKEKWADQPEGLTDEMRRVLHLSATMDSIPSGYFQYYYFEDEVLATLQAKPTTRSEDILAEVPGYWSHYREQVESDDPQLDPSRSRGGIHELELAFDCMDSVFNDKNELMPVNVPNDGTVEGFPDSLIVETVGRCGADWIEPQALPPLPTQVRGLVEALAYYQQGASDVAWSGTARDGVQVLASHPLVRSIDVAEKLYGEMSRAHRDYLPERLIA